MNLGQTYKKQRAERTKKEREDQAEKYQPIIDDFFSQAKIEAESCIKEDRSFVSPTIDSETLIKARYCDVSSAVLFKKWLNDNNFDFQPVDLKDRVALRLIYLK